MMASIRHAAWCSINDSRHTVPAPCNCGASTLMKELSFCAVTIKAASGLPTGSFKLVEPFKPRNRHERRMQEARRR